MEFSRNYHLNLNILKFTTIVLMQIRFNTLNFFGNGRNLKKTLVFLALFLFCVLPNFSQNGTEDVKKQAEKLFEEEEFTQAYKFYSQLVANFPKDPEYNYRLGVCMIYSEPDKKKCIPYLKQAASNAEPPKDVQFYLGKAYHINYLFDQAIKHYNEFKKTASSSRQKKLQVDREIKSCENGKMLLSNLSDLVVKSKKQLNESDYFRSYDLRDIGGKLLVKPEDFRTAADKKKKEKSVMFLPKGGNAVYFSSYGEKGETGKDIYTAAKLPSGDYGKPQKVQGINTEFDEDYPFLHPDGKTLYFASKGHNSMGGYDIFKSVYDEESNSWSKPVNLEFPINSPDDDYLFVTDSLEKTAFFSTGRQSPPGKIDVLRIVTERKPIDVLAIRGNVLQETSEQGLNSVITVSNADSEEAVGTFSAAENGQYLMELPNGARLLFSVETPGQKTQSAEVSLPMATSSKPYKQTIAYEAGMLKIINQFDEGVTDSTYLQYLKVIEKKARLDVNETEEKPVATRKPTLDSTSKQPLAVKDKKNNRPQLVEEGNPGAVTSTNPTPSQSVDNKQLAQIARQDADEAEQEARQLERDARDATELGQKQKEESSKRIAEADEALKQAETLSNEEEKQTAITKANEIKTAMFAKDSLLAIAFAKRFDLKVGDLPFALFFNENVLRDLAVKTGGNPFDNLNTVYTGFPNDLEVNQKAERLPATSNPQSVFGKYDRTGNINKPILAMHTIYDQLIPPTYGITNFENLVHRQQKDKFFVAKYTNGQAHCAFTNQQTGKAFDELRAWVNTGVKAQAGFIE